MQGKISLIHLRQFLQPESRAFAGTGAWSEGADRSPENPEKYFRGSRVWQGFAAGTETKGQNGKAKMRGLRWFCRGQSTAGVQAKAGAYDRTAADFW